MSALPPFVAWLWAVSIVAQVFLFALLFLRGHFRRLSAFTGYVTLDICQAGVLLALYDRVGFGAPAAAAAWVSQAATIGAKALAVGEVCRRILRPYRGIWALGWRLLLGVAGAVLFYAALATHGNWKFAILYAQRGLELAIAVALVVLLLLIRYYLVPVHPALKSIAMGFCVYSCFVVLNNSILEQWRRPYAVLWSAADLLVFLAVVLIWIRALWHPLPSRDGDLSLLPPGFYGEVCSEIHARLRKANERLAGLFKI